MKKLLALLVCVAVVGLCLSVAGCKKKETPPPVTPPKVEAPDKPAVDKAVDDAKKEAEGAAKEGEKAVDDAAKKAGDMLPK